MSSAPDWANPDNTAAVGAGTTQDAGMTGGVASSAGATNTPRGRSGGGRNSFILVALSLVDMGLAAMMATLGVLTLIDFDGSTTEDYSEAFLAAYMIVFALLLFLYECMWWQAIPAVNKMLRRNFGFLYGLKGKGLYLIFVAFLCLGLGKDHSVQALNLATGISFLAVGIFHWVVVIMNPDVSDKYMAPTAGLNLASDSVV